MCGSHGQGPKVFSHLKLWLVCVQYAIHCVCIFGYALGACVCVCVYLTAYPWVSAWMYFLRVCVTVYCMQPCEAVRLLAASRLVFPKQAAGLWLRFVCVCAHVCVCTCLIVTVCKECTLNSPSLWCAFVPVCVILFMNVSVCQPVRLSVCFHLHLLVKWLPVIQSTGCVWLSLLVLVQSWAVAGPGAAPRGCHTVAAATLLKRNPQIWSSDDSSAISKFLQHNKYVLLLIVVTLYHTSFWKTAFSSHPKQRQQQLVTTVIQYLNAALLSLRDTRLWKTCGELSYTNDAWFPITELDNFCFSSNLS